VRSGIRRNTLGRNGNDDAIMEIVDERFKSIAIKSRGATLFGNTGLPITSFPDAGELIIGSLELGNAGLNSIDLSHVSGII